MDKEWKMIETVILGGILTLVQPYVPFILGGIAWFSYGHSIDKVDFSVKSFVNVIGASLLVAYLTLGFMEPLTMFAIKKLVAIGFSGLDTPEVIETIKRFIAFTLGSSATFLIVKFFETRNMLLQKTFTEPIEKKETKKETVKGSEQHPDKGNEK